MEKWEDTISQLLLGFMIDTSFITSNHFIEFQFHFEGKENDC